MFEQERLRGDGAYATGAEQLCAGDHQVNGEDEDFAHRANGTITTGAFKTARRRRIASHYEFAPHTLVSAMPSKATPALTVHRAARQACQTPTFSGNVVGTGKPRLETKLHR